jgi:hypothetical protein
MDLGLLLCYIHEARRLGQHVWCTGTGNTRLAYAVASSRCGVVIYSEVVVKKFKTRRPNSTLWATPLPAKRTSSMHKNINSAWVLQQSTDFDSINESSANMREGFWDSMPLSRKRKPTFLGKLLSKNLRSKGQPFNAILQAFRLIRRSCKCWKLVVCRKEDDKLIIRDW